MNGRVSTGCAVLKYVPNLSPLENPLVASPLMHVDMHNKISDDLISLPLTTVACTRQDAV